MHGTLRLCWRVLVSSQPLAWQPLASLPGGGHHDCPGGAACSGLNMCGRVLQHTSSSMLCGCIGVPAQAAKAAVARTALFAQTGEFPAEPKPDTSPQVGFHGAPGDMLGQDRSGKKPRMSNPHEATFLPSGACACDGRKGRGRRWAAFWHVFFSPAAMGNTLAGPCCMP